MYTLKNLLKLVNEEADIYCKLWKDGRCYSEGWLSDIRFDEDQKIEGYRFEPANDDTDFVDCLLLYLA